MARAGTADRGAAREGAGEPARPRAVRVRRAEGRDSHKVPPKLAELSDRDRAQTMERESEERRGVLARQFGEKIVSDSTKDRPQPSEQPSAPKADNGADNGASPATDRTRSRLPSAPQSTDRRNEPSRNPTLGGPAPGVISDAIRNVRSTRKGRPCRTCRGTATSGRRSNSTPRASASGRGCEGSSRRSGNWFVPCAACAARARRPSASRCTATAASRSCGSCSPVDRRVHEVVVQRDQTVEPTVPLPLEFPDENAPFIVTFYFNETPPGGGSHSAHAHAADRAGPRTHRARGLRVRRSWSS